MFNDQFNKIIWPENVSSLNICSARTFRAFHEHCRHRTVQSKFNVFLIKIHNSEFGNNSDGERELETICWLSMNLLLFKFKTQNKIITQKQITWCLILKHGQSHLSLTFQVVLLFSVLPPNILL